MPGSRWAVVRLLGGGTAKMRLARRRTINGETFALARRHPGEAGTRRPVIIVVQQSEYPFWAEADRLPGGVATR